MGAPAPPLPLPPSSSFTSSRLFTILFISIPTAFAFFKLVGALSFPQPPSVSGVTVAVSGHSTNSGSGSGNELRGAAFAPCYPGLASLPTEGRSWEIYPEDLWDGGRYVWLPLGRMRYWLFGPESGEKIVLVHGLSVPALIWKDVGDTLATQGFRVLVYDLYGRGYSDAPQLAYTTGLYTTQIALLMQHVGWEKAHVAGLSMGGGVAAAFAASFPDMVTGKVVLIASTGIMESADLSRTSKVMSSPVVQYLFSSAPARILLQKLGSGSACENPLHEIVQIQSAFLPGYDNAIASSLRHGPLRGLESSFSALASTSNATSFSSAAEITDHQQWTKPKPELLLIWGTHDRTVPYRYAARMQALVPAPQSRLVTIEGGGHDLTTSHPGEVVRAMVQFLRDGRAANVTEAT